MPSMGRVNHQLVYLVILLLSSGYALLRGGGPERAGASLVLLGSVLSVVLLSPKISPVSRFTRLESGVFLVDLLAYAASLILMLRANRFWTLWMTAMLGVELLAHLLAVPGMATFNLTYAIVERIWGYPLALLPAIGTWRHRQRLRRYGTDSSWSASWRRSAPEMWPGSPVG
jgi:hypothetical protein